jgi:hypothetical protein
MPELSLEAISLCSCGRKERVVRIMRMLLQQSVLVYDP